MVRKSAMAASAVQKWTKAGFELESCQFWKEGRSTASLYMELKQESALPENHDVLIQRLARSQQLLAFSKEPEVEDARRYQLYSKEELAFLGAILETAKYNLMASPAFLKGEGLVATVVPSLQALADILKEALQEAKANNTRKAGACLVTFLNVYLSNSEIIRNMVEGELPYFTVFMGQFQERWEYR